MIFMKCDVNLFKNDDIKFITFISIIHIYSTCNTDEKQIVELMRKITISSINIQKNTQKEEKNG